MNCHIPTAAAFEYASGSYPLSMRARYVMSSGSRPARNFARMSPSYRVPRERRLVKRSRASPVNSCTKCATRSCPAKERTSMSHVVVEPTGASTSGPADESPKTCAASRATSAAVTTSESLRSVSRGVRALDTGETFGSAERWARAASAPSSTRGSGAAPRAGPLPRAPGAHPTTTASAQATPPRRNPRGTLTASRSCCRSIDWWRSTPRGPRRGSGPDRRGRSRAAWRPHPPCGRGSRR